MSDPFRYIFRFCCDPGFNDEAEIQALKRYVREAHIDDVAVFANVEELNTGHMTREEQDVYLRLMERVRDLLAEHGRHLFDQPLAQRDARGPGQTHGPVAGLPPHGGRGGQRGGAVRLPPVREVAKAHRGHSMRAMRILEPLHPVGGGRLPPAQPRAAGLGRVLL